MGTSTEPGEAHQSMHSTAALLRRQTNDWHQYTVHIAKDRRPISWYTGLRFYAVSISYEYWQQADIASHSDIHSFQAADSVRFSKSAPLGRSGLSMACPETRGDMGWVGQTMAGS
jgi:hypothetical protein